MVHGFARAFAKHKLKITRPAKKTRSATTRKDVIAAIDFLLMVVIFFSLLHISSAYVRDIASASGGREKAIPFSPFFAQQR